MIEISSKFQSESAVVVEETGVVVLLSTDNSRFDIKFSLDNANPMDIILALQSIYAVQIPKQMSIAPDNREYEYWLETEILRQVAQKTGMDKNFDPVKKEDYDTIITRRDDLKVRVRSQLSHLDRVKNVVPQIKRRQFVQWKDYIFPMLTLLKDEFLLTIIDRYTISTLVVKSEQLPFYNGFVEFSIPFYEALDAAHADKITLTNISPSRKNNKGIPRILKYKTSVLENLVNNSLLFYLIKTKSIGRNVVLNRVEIFDLLSRIRIHDPQTILRISISYSKSRGSISLKGENVRIKIARKISPIEFSCPLHFLQSLIPIVYMVKEVEMVSTLIGVAFIVKTENFTLVKSYTSKETKILYDLLSTTANTKVSDNNPLVQLIHQQSQIVIPEGSESDPQIISLIMRGMIGYSWISKSIYKMRSFDLFKIKISSLPLVSELIKPLIIRSKYEFKLTYEGHDVIILISDLLKYSCSCGQICDFLKSTILALLEERGYE